MSLGRFLSRELRKHDEVCLRISSTGRCKLEHAYVKGSIWVHEDNEAFVVKLACRDVIDSLGDFVSGIYGKAANNGQKSLLWSVTKDTKPLLKIIEEFASLR